MRRSVVLLAALALSCADDVPSETGAGAADAGSDTSSGTANGAGGSGSGGDNASSTGVLASGQPSTGGATSTGGAGGTGGSEPVGPFPIVLAHGFFGFESFAGVDFATYFYQVKDALADDGELQVFTPAVDPFNDSTTRGAQLLAHVEAILAETGAGKVVIIGHSQGGLDARVVAHDRPDLVAAVLTFATPHDGSPIADVALGITESPSAGLIDGLVNLIGAPLYDEVGNETSVTEALHQFSTPGITVFNDAYPDSPDVFYASITGRTDYHLGGQACAADSPIPLITEWKLDRDPTEPLFWVAEAIADDGNEPNDGLVRARDAKRGEFWGCVPADHMDEVGQLFGDGPGLGNPFDHKALFVELVRELRLRGF